MTLPFPSLEDLVSAISSTVDYIVNIVCNTIRGALIDFYNWLMAGIEWLLNYIRANLPFVISVVLTWTALYKSITAENIPLTRRIMNILTAPLFSMFALSLVDALLPREIKLPRYSYPALAIASVYAETEARAEYIIRHRTGYVVEAEAETEARAIYSLGS